MVKIGSTRSKEIRSTSLNKTRYGNYDDWEILYSFYCINSGKIEDAIQSELKRYSSIEQYNHEGHIQKATEVFRCGYPKAKAAADKMQQELEIQPLKVSEATSVLLRYNFPNLAKALK